MKTPRCAWSLTVKLTLITTMLVIVVISSLTLLSIQREQETFHRELQQQVTLILNALVVTAATPLYVMDGETLTDIARRLRQEQVVVLARFYNLEGRVVAESHPQEQTSSLQIDPFGQRIVEAESPVFAWQPTHVLAGQPVFFENRVVGAISVGLPTDTLQTKIAAMRRQGIVTAVIAILFSVGLALIVSRSITKPLQQLMSATHQLAAGDLSRSIQINSHDELSELADAMEHMRTELQKVYADLECQVAERTRDLQQRNTDLAELNATKDTFFSILSHDLQTPIRGLLDLLKFLPEHLEALTQDELKETLETLHDSLENFSELLNNLFTWSGIQRGTLELHPRVFDVKDVIDRNVANFIPIVEKKQVRLKSTVPPDTLVCADPDMVYAIVRSLVSNAVKFTFPGDKVNLSATPTDTMIAIAVTDTGVGIQQKDIPKLFRPGVSHQTPGTAGEEGMGAGLLLCKELVEQNGGQIEVESEPGAGTTFRFTLPKPPENLANPQWC